MPSRPICRVHHLFRVVKLLFLFSCFEALVPFLPFPSSTASLVFLVAARDRGQTIDDLHRGLPMVCDFFFLVRAAWNSFIFFFVWKWSYRPLFGRSVSESLKIQLRVDVEGTEPAFLLVSAPAMIEDSLRICS